MAVARLCIYATGKLSWLYLSREGVVQKPRGTPCSNYTTDSAPDRGSFLWSGTRLPFCKHQKSHVHIEGVTRCLASSISGWARWPCEAAGCNRISQMILYKIFSEGVGGRAEVVPRPKYRPAYSINASQPKRQNSKQAKTGSGPTSTQQTLQQKLTSRTHPTAACSFSQRPADSTSCDVHLAALQIHAHTYLSAAGKLLDTFRLLDLST